MLVSSCATVGESLAHICFLPRGVCSVYKVAGAVRLKALEELMLDWE